MTRLPTLVVVSGPPGAGKTTLAHAIAARVGCPAVCRDEIKEGMVHATPGFSAGADTELNLRTLSTFFDLLEVLLRAGVTTVAEAAFQDRLWRPGLERLSELADIRIVHCVIAPEVAAQRIQQRHQDNPLRGAHSASTPRPSTHVFDRVSVDTASLEVDTTDGYRPELGEIVAFIDDRRHSKGRGSARP